MKKNGFSLLEILIALIILTVSITAIAGILSTTLFSSSDAENTTIAMNLSQRRMEEIKNLDFDTGIVDKAKADVSGFSGFQREVVVTEPETDLKQVAVSTYWTTKGTEVRVSLMTYISRN